ncbi:unnamed protein product, partial [Discosporangium mesarthrocarpum]
AESGEPTPVAIPRPLHPLLAAASPLSCGSMSDSYNDATPTPTPTAKRNITLWVPGVGLQAGMSTQMLKEKVDAITPSRNGSEKNPAQNDRSISMGSDGSEATRESVRDAVREHRRSYTRSRSRDRGRPRTIGHGASRGSA